MERNIPLLMVIFFLGCGSRTGAKHPNGKSEFPKIDSCATAVLFNNAVILEKRIQSEFSGVLKNYRGIDTTEIDFIHYYENGKLTKSEFYYENGQVEEEFSYLCSSLHGNQIEYY